MLLVAQDVLVLSMDFLSYGRRFCYVQEVGILCTGVLFAFPPPLVGVELKHKHGSCRFL
jgi:hypothetical protein